MIFNMLVSNMIKIPRPKRPKWGAQKIPSTIYYHRIINHPIKDCFILKDKIQALVEMGVLSLNEEKKQPQTWFHLNSVKSYQR